MTTRRPPVRRSRTAFTLVELLVVIGIIALLISILLPSLNRARQSARSVACKSMLRQFAMAGEMYLNDNKGVCVDVYKLYDFDSGLVRYMGNRNQMGDKIARCPADDLTEGMGRLANIGDPDNDGNPENTDAKYQIKDARGKAYSLKVSYGANENSTSASLQPGPTSTSARWTRRSVLRIGGDVSKTMTFADYQNNRHLNTTTDATIAPTVGPGLVPPNSSLNDKMGSLVFRHPNNSMNAAFLDGHVGEIRVGKRLTNSGHDLAAGETWGDYSPTIKYGSYAAHKVFYPFGPGLLMGKGPVVLGTMEGWQLN